MSLEDLVREVKGQPPKNRGWWERAAFTDEDGCSYDRQALAGPLPLGIGLAFVGGLMLVGWATNDPAWHEIVARIEPLLKAAKWLVTG